MGPTPLRVPSVTLRILIRSAIGLVNISVPDLFRQFSLDYQTLYL
jgi:hypothetical protein